MNPENGNWDQKAGFIFIDFNQFETNCQVQNNSSISFEKTLKHVETSLSVKSNLVSSSKSFSINSSNLQIEKFIEILTEDTATYQQIFCNDRIVLLKKVTRDSPTVLIKTVIELHCCPEHAFNLIYDVSCRVKLYVVLSRIEIVKTIHQDTEILYFFFKSPMGISNRNFYIKERSLGTTKELIQ